MFARADELLEACREGVEELEARRGEQPAAVEGERDRQIDWREDERRHGEDGDEGSEDGAKDGEVAAHEEPLRALADAALAGSRVRLVPHEHARVHCVVVEEQQHALS